MSENLEQLAEKINKELEKGERLRDLSEVVLNYRGDDWRNYAKFSTGHYKRNRVYKDDKIEIIIICWNIFQKSKIHDHPNNGCLLRPMKGDLIEKIYKNCGGKLRKMEKRSIYKNGCSYMEGDRKLHKIVNKKNKRVITLHVYSPPGYHPRVYKKN